VTFQSLVGVRDTYHDRSMGLSSETPVEFIDCHGAQLREALLLPSAATVVAYNDELRKRRSVSETLSIVSNSTEQLVAQDVVQQSRYMQATPVNCGNVNKSYIVVRDPRYFFQPHPITPAQLTIYDDPCCQG
jgi:hypothetical protein